MRKVFLSLLLLFPLFLPIQEVHADDGNLLLGLPAIVNHRNEQTTTQIITDGLTDGDRVTVSTKPLRGWVEIVLEEPADIETIVLYLSATNGSSIGELVAYNHNDVEIGEITGISSGTSWRRMEFEVDWKEVERIRFVNQSGFFFYLYEIEAYGDYIPPDIYPPAVPTGLKVDPTDGGGVATWNRNTEPDLAGYRIYLDGNLRNGTLIQGTRYEFDLLTNGQTYTAEVSAVDESGNESEKSAPVQFVPEEPPPVVDDPPGAPKGLKAIPGATEVLLSWQPNRDRDLAGYNLYRDGEKINTTLITTTSYTDKNVSPGTEYTYYLVAVDDAGQDSEASESVTVTTLIESVVTAPSTVSATPNKQDTTITVTWSPVPDATEYNVYRNGVLIGKTSSTSYTDTNVEIGETYFYEITSIIGGVESDLSNIARARIIPDIGFEDGVSISVPDMIQTAWSFLERYWIWVTVVLGIMFAPVAIGLLNWLMTRITGKNAKRIDKQIKSSKSTKLAPGQRRERENPSDPKLSARQQAKLDAVTDRSDLTKEQKEWWIRKYQASDAYYERLTRERKYKQRDTWAREKGYVRPEKREAWTRPDRASRETTLSTRPGRSGRSGRN